MSVRLFIVFLISSSCLIAQQVKVSGNAKSYANDTLVFYTSDDLITKKEVEIGKTTVNDTGYFECIIPLEQTVLAHIYLGIYKGLVFLEPGNDYKIKLPEKTPKDQLELLNPYFKETELYLGVYDCHKNDLNFLIKKFDYYFDQYVKDNFLLLYQNRNLQRDIDTALTELRSLFSFADNKYFNDYVDYKYAGLKFLTYRRDQMVATKLFFLDKPILYDNEAYMEMFNQVFHDFFTHYVTTKDGKNIYSDIAKAKSPHHLKKTLSLNVSLDNDTLQELVILKGLHDAFYTRLSGSAVTFPKRQLMQTLDSMIILTKIPKHKKIAENIKYKVLANKLLKGDDAPYFELYDLNGKKFTINNFKGEYLYLSFYSTYNYECMLDIAMIDNLYKEHKKDVEFVTIICDKDTKNIKDIVQKNEYKWTFLHYVNKPDILDKYFVKVLPAYVLIDPYGKIYASPAFKPDKFKNKFLNILKSRD